MSAYGDHLITSGHYDITSEQERQLDDEREIEHLKNLNADAHAVISKIWEILGNPTYEQLEGRTIYDLVEGAKKDSDRYQYLKGHCSYHAAMTHEQPAEWSIGWEFQQSTPAEAYGSFDKWIDLDIEDHRKRQAEIDAEEANA
ncbi:hypothetical protein [Agrobacterium sp. SUL3]|uniref:hypothetical protein n=1 Tax=Agrobacterium sp. SUL3 TaxID=1701910 RepID=UPI0006997127|nr:hypothetical protein [Agrobacterium sp. SUL3]KNY36069.1 hypothetical protein AKG12_03505 [Agrobacterium sp. SUL3]